MDLPTGTVTFLFSDVEGSTALLRRLERTPALDGRHDRVLRVPEDEEDGVALGAEPLAPCGLGRLAQERLVAREHIGEAVLQAAQQRRRALDVGEEERDGAGGKVQPADST